MHNVYNVRTEFHKNFTPSAHSSDLNLTYIQIPSKLRLSAALRRLVLIPHVQLDPKMPLVFQAYIEYLQI